MGRSKAKPHRLNETRRGNIDDKCYVRESRGHDNRKNHEDEEGNDVVDQNAKLSPSGSIEYSVIDAHKIKKREEAVSTQISNSSEEKDGNDIDEPSTEVEIIPCKRKLYQYILRVIPSHNGNDKHDNDKALECDSNQDQLSHLRQQKESNHIIINKITLQSIILEESSNQMEEYQIKSANGAMVVLALAYKQQCQNKSNTRYQMSTLCTYFENVGYAVENKLIQINLNQIRSNISLLPSTSSRKIEVYIYLTSDSCRICSPLSLGQNILKKTNANHLKKKKNKSSTSLFVHLNVHEKATILQNALCELFPNTILSDMVLANCKKTHFPCINTAPPGSKEGQQRKDDIYIPAETVYNSIDNAHLEDILGGCSNHCYDRNSGDEADISMSSISCQVNGLVPKLREYQEAAVRWMIQRELGDINDKGWEICWVVIEQNYKHNNDQKHDSDEVNDNDGHEQIIVSGLCQRMLSLYEWKKKMKYSSQKADMSNVLFYNPITGWLARTYEEASVYTMDEVVKGDSVVRGGILAESMGLGKTVELLACILSNPYSGRSKDIHNSNDTNNDFEVPMHNHDNYIHSDLICFCGDNNMNKHSLSWVVCCKCGEAGAMHGMCAGYSTEEELIADTKQQRNNKKAPRICSEQHCPTCKFNDAQSSKDNLIHSRATLIVTPASILGQWEREIQKHTCIRSDEKDPIGCPLKVIVYPGVKEICSLSHVQAHQSKLRHLVHAHKLADCDIVLTTFDALMTELGHSGDNPYVSLQSSNSTERSSLRKRKKYRVLPSPLVSIKWWRVCLDEAQRVETPTAASARMLMHLEAKNKWCVSGTPIGKGKMDDLFGLFLFLGAKPFSYKQCFDSYIKSSYRDITPRIRQMTYDLMWRSTKANQNVREQMGIPEQVEKKVILQFSSIERHFYERQLENTVLAADAAMSCGHNKKRQSNKEIDALSLQLHRLRAACCHPQVGSSGISKVRRNQKKNSQNASVANGVLTMAQILDRLIDDAKNKAEESQRVFTLHTNALASLTGLKSELNIQGSKENEEIDLLRKSCDYYFESLQQADLNSTPGAVIGEAIVSGSNGFQSQHSSVRDGATSLLWRVRLDDMEPIDTVWSRFDFLGTAKKINSLVVRPMVKQHENITEDHISCSTHIFPKDCVLLVSNANIGGMFVETIRFTLPCPKSSCQNDIEWEQFTGIRPNRSKSWRLDVLNYHDFSDQNAITEANIFVGVEVQLMEPDIAYDNLQRIHVLHNVSQSLSTLSEKVKLLPNQDDFRQSTKNDVYASANIEVNVIKMQEEAERLESHYIEAARVIQRASSERLHDNICKRNELMSEIQELNDIDSGSLQDKLWSKGLLAWCHLYANSQINQSLCVHVERRLFELFDDPTQTFRRRTFPDFDSIEGLDIALNMRIENAGSFFRSLEIDESIEKIDKLSSHPSEREIFENSHCHKCRADWDQKGPLCLCCKIEKDLIKYEEKIKEPEINCVLSGLAEWFNDNFERLKNNIKTPRTNNHSARIANNDLSIIHQRMEKTFDLKKLALKELETARTKWRTHIDLLSDIDELNQCKRSMRLTYENENLIGMTEHEAAFIVQGCDIPSLIMDHTAKQAMAEANLRRCKDMLRFLKNQNIERKNEANGNVKEQDCVICLSKFGNDRAVLRCGHVFHYHPCLERLISRGGGNTVTCPLRCPIKTRKEDILIANEKRKDDGSKTNRHIEGCWGTKVDRIIADLIDVVEKGEKSIIFSQWDDMLSIMEHALIANNIQFVRPKAIKKIGDDLKQYRTNRCHVLLMHVKHGAEGLTLVEANHVFMIEPLLNHSIDSQAINRIHRIGQTLKTYVHRYIIENTIEVKIDKIRMLRQANNVGDNDSCIIQNNAVKKRKGNDEALLCSAGGLDGMFNQAELQDLLQ